MRKPIIAGNWKMNKTPAEARALVEALVPLAADAQCDVVVCLSHLGWDDDGEKGDCKLMSETSGIDIVLGGHSHSYFKELKYVKNAEGKEIPNDQNGKHGVYVGRIVLSFDK